MLHSFGYIVRLWMKKWSLLPLINTDALVSCVVLLRTMDLFSKLANCFKIDLAIKYDPAADEGRYSATVRCLVVASAFATGKDRCLLAQKNTERFCVW